MEFDMDALFDDATDTPPARVQGRWRTIRLAPDPATGEVLNIGVIFAPNRARVVYKLLPHARAFKCLYGPQGLESFGFLLKVMQEQMAGVQKAEAMPRVSPQVSFGPWKYAAGDSAAHVLESLYASAVTLSRHHDAEPDTDSPGSNAVSTKEFRTGVRRFFSQSESDIFRDAPVSLAGPDGQTHELDMPVWHQPGGLYPDTRIGTLVSCHYKSEIYRQAALGPACQSFSIAVEKALHNEAGLGFFIALRPPEGTAGFNAGDITTIENEIDKLTWVFQKRKQLHVHVVHHAGEAANLVRKLMNQSPAYRQ